MKCFLITFSLLLLSIGLRAQHSHDNDHDNDHNHNHAHNHMHSHDDSRNEIGLSGGAIYDPGGNSWGGGAHLHYYRSLGKNGKWAVGAMLEYAWIHEGHTTVGVGAKYQITDRFSVGVLPGMTFFGHKEHEDHDGHEDHGHDSKAAFSVHFELVYDLMHYRNMHFGPVIDYSWSKGDSHGMIGIHAAYCF